MSEASSAIARPDVAITRPGLFFPVMATIAALIVLAGFSNTFYFRALTGAVGNIGTDPLPLHVIVHGVVFSFWILLFCTQAWLISSGRIRLHRTLGYAGALSAVAVVVAGSLTTVFFVPRAVAAGLTPDSIAGIFTGNFISLISFSVFVGLALGWRRDGPKHKRLMYFATLSILGPALAASNRPLGALLSQLVPQQSIVVIAAMILALFAYDRFSEGRLRAVTIWGAVAIGAKFAINQLVLRDSSAIQDAVLSLA